MKVFIETYGCSLNHADSETMAGNLLQAGHELAATEAEADVILYNTCSVKNPTQDHFLSTLKKQQKPVVIAGCLPQADKRGMFRDYAVLGTEQLTRASEIVEAAATGKQLQLLEKNKEAPRLNMPKVRTNPLVEIVPICAGCLSNCTYCKTKQARGNLRSYRPMDIQMQCEQAIAEGVKEIWLTSQDNGAYGMDIKTNAGELLSRIARLDGDFMIRFGMTNPDWTKKWLNELISAFKEEKVYKFLHLPIQSGADSVLSHMKRRCTADDIRHIVKRFREEIPGITIATDIICGYPTETEEDFEQTLALVRELKFPVINISKFYPRPDTPAAAIKPLPTEVVKARSSKLTAVFEEEILPMTRQQLVGKSMRALFVQRTGNTNIGKLQDYTQVLVESDQDLRGTWQQVHITQAGLYDVRGVLEHSAR
jgi:threonylcarbamoyladenosine tRNA methylthiotransferase CDKAL1